MWKNIIYLLLLLVFLILVFRWNGMELMRFSILEGATGKMEVEKDDKKDEHIKSVKVKPSKSFSLPQIKQK